MKKSTRMYVVLAGVAVVGVGVAWALASRGKDDPGPRLDIPLGKAAVTDVRVKVVEIGTVEPEVKVDVKSVLSGKVVALPIREGDVVRRGQLLAAIEPDVNQAQTLAAVRRSVNQAAIEFNDAERDFRAKDELLRGGLISLELHRAAETRYKAARETLETAREKASLLEASGIPIDPDTSQALHITSPMDGVVIRRTVELGDVVTGAGSFNAGTVIATVADLSSMIVKVGVNEVDIGKVRMNAPVTVTLDAYPKVRFAGKVSRIAPAARLQDQVKVFDVEVQLDSQGRELRTGMTANITIDGEIAEGVLAVPVEAVFRRDDGEVVYLHKKADAGGKKTGAKAMAGEEESGSLPVSDPKTLWKQHFEERRVVTGLASLSHAQVLEGLAEGDEVALEDPTRPKKKENQR
ncbi:MAG: efflux RND transporter periplasmic adaptor subunit [Acidobacteriota bacterium]